MSDEPKAPVADPWANLRSLTAARVGLARAGASLATAPLLDFRLAHARARDAVTADFNAGKIAEDLAAAGIDAVTGDSAAPDKRSYLMRPDLGRRLAPETEAMLNARPKAAYDIAFVVSDGLSALAVEAHAAALLTRVVPRLRDASLTLAPITIVRGGRVAIGDHVAGLTGASCAVVLIGERPGLSAPDSMGAYLTWMPGGGTTDADRNCISNIRPDGIGYDDAAFKLIHLLQAIRALRRSGVALKDTSDSPRLVSD